LLKTSIELDFGIIRTGTGLAGVSSTFSTTS